MITGSATEKSGGAQRRSRPADSSTLEFDLNDPAFITDPYPTYARLRATAPVYYCRGLDLWIVSRHADVAAVVRDHARFSSDTRRLVDGLRLNPFNPAMRVPWPVAALAARLPFARILLTSDPPEHTVLRRKITKAFTPRAIASWEPRVRDISERLVDGLPDEARGPIDLVQALASPLPTVVIAEILGVPPARHPDFKQWSDALVAGLVSGGSIARAAKRAVEISAFFARVVRDRRRAPRDDLVSRLVADNDDALTVRELVTFCVLLLVAGNETTTSLTCNAVIALLDHPDAMAQVAADPNLVARAVEETLRYDGPAQGLLRTALSDVTFGPSVIPRGSRVLALIGSANRDPHWLEDADEFRLDRPPVDHLAFGSGIHHCIGAPLARLESRVALETLFQHVSRIAAAGAPRRIRSPVLRGVQALPLTVQKRRV